jgi:cyclophilin family peptidyl-prolyl cis-trans isomerase
MCLALPFSPATRFASALRTLLVSTVFLTIAPSLFAQYDYNHPPPRPTAATSHPQITIVIARRGTVLIELYPNAAPKTVAHIVDLVNRKFYDGLLFHRVIPGFIAQAGDPKSRNMDGAKLKGLSDLQVAERFTIGDGGSGKKVVLEVKLPHERGTVGLAHSRDIDSGDSQFFFNLKPNPILNARNCVFGKVVKGLDIVDKIEIGDCITSLRVTRSR